MPFDPNKPFEKMKSGFDPNRKFEQLAPSGYVPQDNPTVNPDAMVASGAHALNALLFGHAPQAYGAMKNPAGALKAIIDPETQNAQNNNYIVDRDKATQYLKDAQSNYPGSSFAGKFGGTALTSIIPSAAIGPAATAAGRVGQATALGAGFGALQNPGDTPGVAQGIQTGARGINAAIGGGVGGAAALAGELLAGAGAKAAGFNTTQKEAYRAAPDAVKEIARNSDVVNRAKAEDIINTSSDALKELSLGKGGLNESLNNKLAGKYIPESAVSGPQARLPEINSKPMSVDPGTGQIEAKDLRRAMQELGDQQYIKHPITGEIVGKNPETSAAYAQARQALTKFIPEAEGDLSGMHTVIDAQSGLKPGLNKPINFLKTTSPDTAAARQAVDEIVGGGLDDAAKQFSAGYQIKSNDGLVPMLGRKAITASKSAQPVGLTLGQLLESAKANNQ